MVCFKNCGELWTHHLKEINLKEGRALPRWQSPVVISLPGHVSPPESLHCWADDHTCLGGGPLLGQGDTSIAVNGCLYWHSRLESVEAPNAETSTPDNPLPSYFCWEPNDTGGWGLGSKSQKEFLVPWLLT